MKLKKLSISSIMCTICAIFLLGTAITVFANENVSEDVSIGTFYEISEDEEDSGSEVSVGTFEIAFDEENDDSVGALTDENNKDVSIGTTETVDEE